MCQVPKKLLVIEKIYVERESSYRWMALRQFRGFGGPWVTQEVPDLVENAFAEVISRIKDGRLTLDGRSESNLAEYIGGVLKNLVFNFINNHKRRERFHDDLLCAAVGRVNREANQFPVDFHEDLQRVFGRLPQDIQEALALRYRSEFKIEEIANTLGCSAGQVHKLIKNGLAVLRALLDGSVTSGNPEDAQVAKILRKMHEQGPSQNIPSTAQSGRKEVDR